MDQGGKIRTANILRGDEGRRVRDHACLPRPAGCGRFAGRSCRGLRPLRRLAGATERHDADTGAGGPLPVAVATDRSAAGAAYVARALAARPDVVVVDFPHAAVLLPDRIDVRSVMFTHNVEAEIFERHAAVAEGLWQPVWQREARRCAASKATRCAASIP